MKLLFLLVVLPLAFGTPDKRFIMDNILQLVNLTMLQQDLQTIIDVVGSDPTEQTCERECHVVAGHELIDTACPLLCHSLQELAHYFKLTTPTPVGK